MILIKNKEQANPRTVESGTDENHGLGSKGAEGNHERKCHCSKVERNSCIFCLGTILLIYKLSQFLPILLHISYIPILINHAHIFVLCLWLEKFSLSHE